MSHKPELPVEVMARIDLEAKQYAFYNYVTAANSAVFDNIETWPHYAQVAYYSIWHYMIGDLTCWPYQTKTIPVEYATKLHHVQQENAELRRQNEKLKEQAAGWRPLLEEVIKHDAVFGELYIEMIDKIKKFLYGE